MIEIIQDPNFINLTSVGHAFFTRKGGVSKDYYHSLNCSLECGDNPENVIENRRRAMDHLNFQLDSLITVNSEHGNQVYIVEQLWMEDQKPTADAMVTKLKHIVLASDSADCPIILFADEQAEIIGLAHSGWKGAKLNIVEKTVEQMVLLGANHNNICAVISPCITQDSYEVSTEFYQQFIFQNSGNCDYFNSSNKKGHFMFDLLHFVKNQLIKLNLKSVSTIGLDTYSNEKLFFSCRRALHQGEPDFGGQLSCIYLK